MTRSMTNSKRSCLQWERYHVSLPFKEGHPLLSDNFPLSKQRLKSSLNNLKSKPEILAEYDQILCEQECLGITETIPEEEVKGKAGETTYKEIICRDKSTACLRVINDVSATCNGIPWNQCLHTGPLLLLKISVYIMLHFHSKQVELVSDAHGKFVTGYPLSQIGDPLSQANHRQT